MTRRQRTALSLAAVAVATAVVLTRATGPAGPPALTAPRVEYPTEIDLGECEYGSDKWAEFTVRNAGDNELVLYSFATSCTCSSIARRGPHGDGPIDRIRLAAGEETRVAVKVSVRARVNAAARTRVSFQTTDPATPRAEVVLAASRVIGGFTPIPGSCNFGTVFVGSDCRRVVHLLDEAVAPRAVTAVVATPPDRVRAEFEPTPGGAKPADVPNPGHYIGRLSVTLDTTAPGAVDGQVVVHYDDGTAKTEVVPVLGRVVPDLSVTPELLTLRRFDGAGEPVLAGTVWLRGRGAVDRSSVRVEGPGKARAVAADGDGDLVPVRIEFPAADAAAGGERKLLVELSAAVGGATRRVPLTLFLDP